MVADTEKEVVGCIPIIADSIGAFLQEIMV
jgi:hypothetical protein